MEGVKVYVPDAQHVWLPAIIISAHDQNEALIVRVEDITCSRISSTGSTEFENDLRAIAGQERSLRLKGSEIEQTIKSGGSGVGMRLESMNISGISSSADSRNKSFTKDNFFLPLQNSTQSQQSWKGFDDMIKIDHLHEASILYNLRHRFYNDLPYTYTGNICIAVNPYQWLDLYTPKMMELFSDGNRDNKPTHVYAISMDAFFQLKLHRINQSILVSGESGAGKTETTKIVMGHLASLAANADSKVIQQIIQINPLLESFGNAKTIRNDNSSRFGKFTELQFHANGSLVGARSRTYLLEKSRVTTQAVGERNFHVFYQLLQQMSEFPELKLDSEKSFRYIRDVDFCLSSEDGINEKGHLDQTRKALSLIGIDDTLQHEIFCILAGILHLGQVDFTTCNGDVDTSKVKNSTPFQLVANLLGVQVVDLEQAICFRNVCVGREVISKPMTPDQATDCRDALAKSLYSRLFVWLVDQINEIISVKVDVTRSAAASALSFIGILDIFGFEHFKSNSFEQFCINYANEKLQQKFVQDVLKSVQIEYDEENITWSHIRFQDNQEVLDLIEGRMGVLSFLNEESLLATGSDAAFASKLGAVMETNVLLETPRLNQCAFSIYHYAGKVTYDATGFLDKHRDAILPDIKQVMSSSQRLILSATFSEIHQGPASKAKRLPSRLKGHAQARRTTVGTQFKESLAELMEKIGKTGVHYVRCLKPNSYKSPHCFTHEEIVSQLRCAGVIEAIRVSRCAYPSRIPHSECMKKFRVLLPVTSGDTTLLSLRRWNLNEQNDIALKDHCEHLMMYLLPNKKIKDYQVGLTRVYFRESVLEQLETQRICALRNYTVILQNRIRSFLTRRRFVKAKASVICIQTLWRGFVLRKRYKRLQQSLVRLQALYRGRKARQNYRMMRFDHSIVRMQALCRQYIHRKKYLRKVKAAKLLQSFWRILLVRQAFRIKMEQEKRYKALGSKVARLQRKLDPNTVKQSSVPNSTALGSDVFDSSYTIPRSSSVQSRSSLSTNGILDESHEVITALHLENGKLRGQLDGSEDIIRNLRAEIRSLRNWQQSKEVDEKVQKIAHRDQVSKDLIYLWTLEGEYERLRLFLCQLTDLPADIGAIQISGGGTKEPNATNPYGSTSRSNSLRSAVSGSSDGSESPSNLASTSFQNGSKRSQEAHTLLTRCASRLAHVKSNVPMRGSARRVKDHWEEIRNFPPPLPYSLGSIPWQRLLTDWAQGNPRKLDYMKRWLKNILDGGRIVSDSFPMGVELKSVTPMMLDGFMQLIIPKLAERKDIQVHVHTKEFIGTSMRITLSERDPKAHINAPMNGAGKPELPPDRKKKQEFYTQETLYGTDRMTSSTDRSSSFGGMLQSSRDANVSITKAAVRMEDFQHISILSSTNDKNLKSAKSAPALTPTLRSTSLRNTGSPHRTTSSSGGGFLGRRRHKDA